MNPSRRLIAFAIVAVLGASTIASADPLRCSIIGTDFEPRVARVSRIDDSGIQFSDNTTGASGALPVDSLVRLESFPGPDAKSKAATASGAYVVLLRDGQRWVGMPGAMTGDDLEWIASDIFGGEGSAASGHVPLKSIVAIASLRGSSPADADRAASSGAASMQDELRLTNGDVVAGVVSASDGKTITCAGADGQPVTIDWTNVRVAKFAAVSSGTAAPARAPFRLTLRDGRVIDGSRVAADGENLSFVTTHGGTLNLTNGAGVVAIEHTGSRVKMLADLPPAEASQSPYFPTGASATAKTFDIRSAAIVLGNRAFRSSILARPHSSIRWVLDGTSETFVTRYAIPAGRPLADVTVRVKLDDKVVHERQHVKADDLAELLKLPIGASKSLTLEVDYGDAYDVQDDFYWLEPALLAH